MYHLSATAKVMQFKIRHTIKASQIFLTCSWLNLQNITLTLQNTVPYSLDIPAASNSTLEEYGCFNIWQCWQYYTICPQGWYQTRQPVIYR